MNQKPMTHLGYSEVPEEEKKQLVSRFFSSVSKQYDAMNTLLSFGIHYLWKIQSVNMLDLKPGNHVLDVCGGTGDLSILSKKKVGNSGSVVLCDFNLSMIEAGKNKSTNKTYRKQIDYCVGDAEKLPFSDHSFDAAIVGFGIRNLTKMENGFKEMFRILKPGGKMVCLEFSKPTSPVFGTFYDFYSFQIMPVLGEIIAGTRTAYTYLSESIRIFPLPDDLSKVILSAGFSKVIYKKMTNGIAVAHLAQR